MYLALSGADYSATRTGVSSYHWNQCTWLCLVQTTLLHVLVCLHNFSLPNNILEMSFPQLFLAQTKGRRERERERKRKGKEEERKGEREREIGSEALAETEKIANAPAGNRTRDPSKRGWCSTIEPPRQATSPASLFEILSALPPLHNIGIIQCPQLTNPQLFLQCTPWVFRRTEPNSELTSLTMEPWRRAGDVREWVIAGVGAFPGKDATTSLGWQRPSAKRTAICKKQSKTFRKEQNSKWTLSTQKRSAHLNWRPEKYQNKTKTKNWNHAPQLTRTKSRSWLLWPNIKAKLHAWERLPAAKRRFRTLSKASISWKKKGVRERWKNEDWT